MAYGSLIIGSLRRRTLDRRGWHRRLLNERRGLRRRDRAARRSLATRIAVAYA